MEKSICFFASYFTENIIPYYVKVYLCELKKQFDKVVLISTQSSLSDECLLFLDQNNIDLMTENNEGYDFGLWYKAFKVYDLSGMEKVALVNDSCILFRSLDAFMLWSKNDHSDLQGITYSEAVSKHIQSYFLIINKKAIEFVKDYFNINKIITGIEEVIKVYEIGLSSELLANGFTINAYMDNDGYKGEFSPYYQCIRYHIAKGIPMIKKKIIEGSYRKRELATLARMNFNISPIYYLHLIKSNNEQLIVDANKLLTSLPYKMNGLEILLYRIKCLLIKIFRPLYRLIKKQ